MGLFDTIKNAYQDKKAAEQAERDFVYNDKGTEAICAYMKTLFDKGNSGYNWLKENRGCPLYPVVEDNQVLLCYQYSVKNPQSFKDMKPQDVEVARYSFRQMYQWYGLAEGEGYNFLDTKIKKHALAGCIRSKVGELPHIKDTSGFTVKLFG